MILQVRADARQMQKRVDAMDAELRGIADARQHQKLRRADRAGCDDQPPGPPHRASDAISPVFETDRALALEQNPRGVRVRENAAGSARLRTGFRNARAVLMRRPLRCVTWK